MNRPTLAVAAIALFVSAADAAEEDLVVCRTASGEVMVVDVPPPGCAVEEKHRGVARSGEPPAQSPPVVRRAPPLVAVPAAPPAREGFLDLGETIRDPERLRRFDAHADDERRALERRGEDNRARLDELRERIRSLLEESREDLRRGAGGAEAYADALQRRDAAVTRLRTEEVALREEWRALEREFELLSAKVQRAHGGTLPQEWLPKLTCEKCP
jgi:ElaB/YqjD/DUF883 family membrane-anchored ribosome-binding protein